MSNNTTHSKAIAYQFGVILYEIQILNDSGAIDFCHALNN